MPEMPAVTTDVGVAAFAFVSLWMSPGKRHGTQSVGPFKHFGTFDPR